MARKGDVLRQEKLELEKELSEHRLVAHDVADLLDLFHKKNDCQVCFVMFSSGLYS